MILHVWKWYVFKKFCFRFNIKKKLREVKKKEKDRTKGVLGSILPETISQRSHDRRKVIEDKKDSKKLSAFQDLKAKREEKKKQGK